MNSVTPTPTPTPTPITSQSPTYFNSSLLEADFAVGIIMVILGILIFIIFIMGNYINKRDHPKDTSNDNYIRTCLLYSLVIIISGVFLILTSKNKNRYVVVKQNSVSPIDILYGLIYIVLTVLILILLVVAAYFSHGKTYNIGYFAYSIVLGFLATLMVNGIKYILSGES